MGMLPGMGNIKALAENKPDEKQMSRVEAIINSMTPDERRKQHIINGSRRKRIAKGSRHDGRGSESSAEAVRADAEDAEVARRDGRDGRGRRQEGAPPGDGDAAQPGIAARGC